MSRNNFSTANYLHRAASVISANSDFTAAAWVYPSAVPGGVCIFCGDNTTTNNIVQLWLRASNIVRGRWITPSGNVSADAGATYSTGVWQLVGMRKWLDGATQKFETFLGASIGTAQAITIGTPTRNTFALGVRLSSSPGLDWSGSIGPVGIWDRKMSDEEIAALANTQWDFRRFGCDHYYELDGSNDGDVDDLVGSADLTENGAVFANALHPTLLRRHAHPGLYRFTGGAR